jgi:hypothetical protein
MGMGSTRQPPLAEDHVDGWITIWEHVSILNIGRQDIPL